MEYVTPVLILLLGIYQIYLKSHIGQLAKNQADIEQNRKKEYESEKGRGLATKEDIEEITKKIEQVKAEISFKNEWEHEHIRHRRDRLNNILFLAQKIVMAQNRISILSANALNVHKLFDIIEELNHDSVELTHEGNLMIADLGQFRDIDPVTKLVDNVFEYAVELSCLANNVANSLQIGDTFKSLAFKDNVSFAEAEAELHKATELIAKAKQLEMAPLVKKEGAKTAINEYIAWLEKKNEDGMLLRYNIHESPDS